MAPRRANGVILCIAPGQVEEHILFLSFNDIPVPDSLIEARVDHPEFFPDDMLVRWTQEQDRMFEATLGELRGQQAGP